MDVGWGRLRRPCAGLTSLPRLPGRRKRPPPLRVRRPFPGVIIKYLPL